MLEDPAKSYHAKHRVMESDIFDNRPIFGDNLLALEAEDNAGLPVRQEKLARPQEVKVHNLMSTGTITAASAMVCSLRRTASANSICIRRQPS